MADMNGQYEDRVQRVLDLAKKIEHIETPDNSGGSNKRSEAISEAIREEKRRMSEENECNEETIRGGTMREVRMALISWVDAEGFFGCLHLLDHTPEQQAEVQQKLQTLQGARQLVVFRFYSMAVPPDVGNNNNDERSEE